MKGNGTQASERKAGTQDAQWIPRLLYMYVVKRGNPAPKHDRIGGKNRCRVDRVRIDEIVHDSQEDEHHAEAEGRRSDHTDNPWNRWIVRPCKPEQANGDGYTTKHGWW